MLAVTSMEEQHSLDDLVICRRKNLGVHRIFLYSTDPSIKLREVRKRCFTNRTENEAPMEGVNGVGCVGGYKREL